MNESKLSPALLELVQLNRAGNHLGVERRLRPAQSVPVPVVNNTHNLKEKTDYFGAPGTITVFVGRSDASINRVRRAVEEGGKSVLAIVNEIIETPPGEHGTLEEALNAIAAAPVFATLIYGGTDLVEYLHIPEGQDLIGFTLPYNGGRLARQGFELRQFHKGGATLYQAIALQTMPELTAAEIAALEQIPEPELQRNVGPTLTCNWACAVAFASGAVAGGVLGAVAGAAAGGPAGAIVGGAVGAVGAGAAAVGAYNAVAGALEGVDAGGDRAVEIIKSLKLADEDVHRLGAEGTARALLELRRIALLRSATSADTD